MINSYWVQTSVMAEHLGIHPQTLLKLRRSPQSPFRQGRDFRFAGLSTGKLQWHIEAAEAAFTAKRCIPCDQVETYGMRLSVNAMP